jgi:hypothetical protein
MSKELGNTLMRMVQDGISKSMKDNNPSPQEAIDKIEIRIGSMSLQLGKEFKIIEQALTNYANMVEMLEGLVEKYEGEINHNFREVEHKDNVIISVHDTFRLDTIADITKVLEGKINE